MKSNRNPLIPMGAITGDPSREEIRTMFRRYSEAGITQFLIYPRDGCDVEYMSERWFEIVGDILEYAREYGMDIWLYDEFNWPSGTCFGAVLREDPEFVAKCVKVTENGYEIVNSAMESWRVPGQYADILNPDAVDCFVRLTHERYFERFGEYFGSTIKGIFTDEPSILHFMNSGGLPYYKGLEADYLSRTGRDFATDLKNKPGEFFRDFYGILGERFRDVFVKRISDWCDSHGILLTGHLLSDENIDGWVKSNGNALDVLRSFGLPGIDEINTQSMENWQLYGYEQAAVRVRKNGGLAELFALGPTDLPPSRVEQQIWLVAMFGVDHYVLAVSAIDARGNVKKNGWYNPMNYANPWFAGYSDLGLSAKKAADFAKKEIDADVLVRIPLTEYKYFMADAYSAERSKLRNEFDSLLRILTREQYQWLLIDDKEDAENLGLPVLDVAKADAKTLVEELKAVKTPSTRVFEPDGSLPEHLLFRRFTDGTAVALDLRDSDESRDLILKADEETPFTLPGRGHFATDENPPRKYETVSEIKPEFNLTLDHPNTLRANIRSDKTRFDFRVEEKLDGIRLLCRNYIPGGEISLDGIKLRAANPANALTPGLSGLYLSTDEFTLMPGDHRIEITRPAQSEPFLPSCFVCGRFASSVKNEVTVQTDGENGAKTEIVKRADVLKKLPGKVGVGLVSEDILPQYAGMAAFEAMIEIPEDGDLKLSVGVSRLYTRVKLNGVDLGGRLNGYVWEIPEELRGSTVLLRIEEYTSIGPALGRPRDALVNGDGEKWTNIAAWFPYKYERCGVEWVRFVR